MIHQVFAALGSAERRGCETWSFFRAAHAREREGMMDEPTLEALSRRVDRLEQAKLRWKHLASWALALLGLVVLLGAAASKRAKSPAELRAQRIVLVDNAEKGRAALTVTSDNRPELVLIDDAG